MNTIYSSLDEQEKSARSKKVRLLLMKYPDI